MNSETSTEESGLSITRVESAKQNVTNNILREKPEEWPSYLPHTQMFGNGTKYWWIPNETFKLSNVARLLMVR